MVANIFGEDYYVELQRHDIPEQDKVNKVSSEICKKIQCKSDCHQ